MFAQCNSQQPSLVFGKEAENPLSFFPLLQGGPEETEGLHCSDDQGIFPAIPVLAGMVEHLFSRIAFLSALYDFQSVPYQQE